MTVCCFILQQEHHQRLDVWGRQFKHTSIHQTVHSPAASLLTDRDGGVQVLFLIPVVCLKHPMGWRGVTIKRCNSYAQWARVFLQLRLSALIKTDANAAPPACKAAVSTPASGSVLTEGVTETRRDRPRSFLTVLVNLVWQCVGGGRKRQQLLVCFASFNRLDSRGSTCLSKSRRLLLTVTPAA